MKLWESRHVFEHPWDTVVQATWRKYPNPISTAVKGIDILDRKVTPDGKLQTKRLIKTEWDIPGWATSLIGLTNPSYSHETSEVDAAQRTMTQKTQNLDCTNFVSVDEKLVYQPHPEDSSKTLLVQSTEVTVRGVPLISCMEDIICNVMSSNSAKVCLGMDSFAGIQIHTDTARSGFSVGRNAMEWVIANIKREYEDLSEKINMEYNQLTRKVNTEMYKLHSEINSVRSNIEADINASQRQRLNSESR